MNKVPVGRLVLGWADVVVEVGPGGRAARTPVRRLRFGGWVWCDPFGLNPGDLFKVHDLPGDTFRAKSRAARRPGDPVWELEAELIPEGL